MNRRKKPPPPAATIERLRELLERHRAAAAGERAAADELALEALRAAEAGATRQAVADALGVGPSTVQGWVDRGRQLTRG